jgi:hypothetical protein
MKDRVLFLQAVESIGGFFTLAALSRREHSTAREVAPFMPARRKAAGKLGEGTRRALAAVNNRKK